MDAANEKSIDENGAEIMAEPVFTSPLSENEMLDNFKNVDLFAGIMEALHDAIDFEKGKTTPTVTVRESTIPETNMRK